MRQIHTKYIIILALAIIFTSPFPSNGQQGEISEKLVLTLDEAIQMALKSNEAVKISKEEIIKARAVLLENTSAALPHLGAVAGFKHNIEQPSQEMDFSAFDPMMQAMGLPPMDPVEIPLVYKYEWTFAATLNQNIYTFGRIYNAIKLAKQYESISKESARLTDDEIKFEATKAYYDMILANRSNKIAIENFIISEKNYNNVKSKVKAGIKSEFDELQSRAELANSKPYVISTKTAVVLSKKNMNRILGLDLDREVEAADDFLEFCPFLPLDALIKTATYNRKEIRLLRLEEDMKHTTGNLYMTNMLPVLSADMAYSWIGSSITYEERVWPEEDGDWYNFWHVGITFSWPLFDGLESYAKMRQARSEERITLLKKAQLLKGIELELTQLQREFYSLKEELEARKEAVEVGKKAFDLASIRYDSGLGTALEKSNAQFLLMQAKAGLIQTLHKLNITRASLTKALGKDVF